MLPYHWISCFASAADPNNSQGADLIIWAESEDITGFVLVHMLAYMNIIRN